MHGGGIKMIQSRTLQVTITAIAVWVSYYFLFADTSLIYSTPDAQSYINYASYRLPVYGWLAFAWAIWRLLAALRGDKATA